MFISFEYSSCPGNLIRSTSCLFLVWFGDQEWHCDKNHNHLFWILLGHKCLEERIGSASALHFWGCQLYVFIKKKKFKTSKFNLNGLKDGSVKYFENSFKSLHLFHGLIWSINLWWASMLIQIFLPDTCVTSLAGVFLIEWVNFI